MPELSVTITTLLEEDTEASVDKSDLSVNGKSSKNSFQHCFEPLMQYLSVYFD